MLRYAQGTGWNCATSIKAITNKDINRIIDRSIRVTIQMPLLSAKGQSISIKVDAAVLADAAES